MHTAELDVPPLLRAIALRTFPAFEQLSPADLASMAEHVRPRLYRRGDVLSRRGVPVRSLHFVLRGEVEVDDGRGKPRTMGPRDVVGGLGALSLDPMGQQAVATQETLTLKLDRDDMEEVFEDQFAIFLGVLRALARALVSLEKRLGRDEGLRIPRELALGEDTELGLVERILLLRSSMNFAGAEIEALADLAQECESFELPAEGVLWRAGDAAEDAILLVTGRIRAAAGDRDPFWFDGGTWVGGMEALSGEPRWYYATADGPVRGLRIELGSLLDVVEDHMGIGMNLLRTIARSIRDVSEHVPD